MFTPQSLWIIYRELGTYNTYLYDVQLLNNYQVLPTIIPRFGNNNYLLERG